MNTTQLERNTHAAIDAYITDLDSYSMDQLLAKPSSDSWSIGQVYIHLWMSAKGFFFKKAEQCLSKENVETGVGKNWKGWIVFTLGKMPVAKVKMPASIAVQPREPESKEQLVAKLNEIKQMATDYIKRIPDSDPSLKVKHPFLGYLNTAEWIALCNVHFQHHEGQKKRIRKQLSF